MISICTPDYFFEIAPSGVTINSMGAHSSLYLTSHTMILWYPDKDSIADTLYSASGDNVVPEALCLVFHLSVYDLSVGILARNTEILCSRTAFSI